MRITFLLPNIAQEGGVRVVATQAKLLRARGHDVHAYSLGREPVPTERRLKNAAKQLLRFRPIDAIGQLSMPAWNKPTHFDDAPSLHTRINHGGPITARDIPDADVIVATWWETAEWMMSMPASKGAKVHLIQHDERAMMPERSEEIVRWTWKQPGVTRVSVSEWIAEIGRREFQSDSIVIENAVDHEVFNAPPRSRNKRFTVGFMSSDASFKAAANSVAAVKLARRNGLDCDVISFGHASKAESMQSIGLMEDCRYEQHPPQSKLAQLYAGCDVFLMSSRLEGYGLPTLEAMACGTPVIATPAGAAPQLIEAKGAGRLVPVDDAGAMASAMQEIANLPADPWKLLSDAALATAGERHWDAAVDAFERVLRTAASDQRPGAAA